MSLQLAAQHMASRGRGPDTQLVHMAPQEVAGLQALAKAHGGSLTTNPDTGLPEAGFLSSILPMVIGGALAATGVGAPMAAMMVGGGYGLATGSLSKGLMAGLGAFGGAGLAGGLMSAGAAGAAGAAEAGLSATGAGASEMAATNAALQQNALTGIGIDSTAAAGTGSMSFAPNMGTNVLGTTPLAGPMSVPVSTSQLTAGVPQVATATPISTAAPTFSDNLSQLGRGFQNLGTEAGRDAFMSKAGVDGGMGLLKYGYAAGLPMLMQEPKKAEQKPSEKPWMYSYDPGRVADPQAGYTGAATGERNYFNPVYTRTAAGGGLMDIGPVEAMSDRNQAETMMANGGMRYAEGGETKAVKPVEENPYYTMSGQSGDAFKYLMGQGQKPAPVTAPATATAPVQPAVSAPASTMGGLTQSPDGSPLSATLRPYTFDPATGTFTAMPVIEPVVAAPLPSSTPNEGGGYAGGNSADAANGASGLGTGVSGFGSSYARGGIAALAQGGQSHLGDYSDGGRLLKGPGDGVSDSIPATIGDKRPARLADGEFVVPARIVSELGNGSTEAGARKLYAMMDRVQKARSKTVGKDRVAVNSRAEKLLPV